MSCPAAPISAYLLRAFHVSLVTRHSGGGGGGGLWGGGPLSGSLIRTSCSRPPRAPCVHVSFPAHEFPTPLHFGTFRFMAPMKSQSNTCRHVWGASPCPPVPTVYPQPDPCGWTGRAHQPDPGCARLLYEENGHAVHDAVRHAVLGWFCLWTRTLEPQRSFFFPLL